MKTKSNPHGLEVGQILHIGYRDWRRNASGLREAKITKVGRVWAELNIFARVHLEKLHVDSGDLSIDRDAYLSLNSYQLAVDREAAWGSLRRAMNLMHKAPRHITPEKIREIEGILTDG